MSSTTSPPLQGQRSSSTQEERTEDQGLFASSHQSKGQQHQQLSPSSGGKWVCPKCEAFTFDSYEDMMRHESECRLQSRGHGSYSSSGRFHAEMSGSTGHAGQVRGGNTPPSGTVGGEPGGTTVTPMQRSGMRHQSQRPSYQKQQQHQEQEQQQVGQRPSSVSFSPSSTPGDARGQSSAFPHRGAVTGTSTPPAYSSPSSKLIGDASKGARRLGEPQPLAKHLSSDEIDRLSQKDQALCESIVLFTTPDDRQQPAITGEEGDDEPSRGTKGMLNVKEEDLDSRDSEQLRRSPPIITPTTPRSSKRQRIQHVSSASQRLPQQQLIGFQCRYCMESPLAVQPTPSASNRFDKVFPGSVESMGSTLELVKHRHLMGGRSGGGGACDMVPDDVRHVFQEKECGQGSKGDESRALQEVCEQLCRRLGIENRRPHKTGIVTKARGVTPSAGTPERESERRGMEEEERRQRIWEARHRSQKQQQQQQQQQQLPEQPLHRTDSGGQQAYTQQEGGPWTVPTSGQSGTNVGLEMHQAMMGRYQQQQQQQQHHMQQPQQQQAQQQQQQPQPQQPQPQYPPSHSPYAVPGEDRYASPYPMGGAPGDQQWAGAPPPRGGAPGMSMAGTGAGGAHGVYGYPHPHQHPQPQYPQPYPPMGPSGYSPGGRQQPLQQQQQQQQEGYPRDSANGRGQTTAGGNGGNGGGPPHSHHYAQANTFVRDMAGGFSCPHCNMMPYHVRAPQSWSRDPPSQDYMDQHFSMCTGLSQGYARGSGGPPSGPVGGAVSPAFAPPPSTYGQPPPPYGHPQYPPSASGWPAVPSPVSRFPHQDAQQQHETGAGAPTQQHDPAQVGGGMHFHPPPHPPVAPPHGAHHPHPHYPAPPHHPHHQPSHLPHHPPQHREIIAGGMTSPHVTGQGAIMDSSRAAAEFLAAESSRANLDTDPDALVLPEDRVLLTDYFYFLNQQLKLCRFTERDRKTRGGKRENIELGYGGLECRHCAGESGSRKFFWSDVDRLANSFAEIPGHIMKCRKCPEEVKSALQQLKLCHPEQMAKLPRGSQKVFFRRMWRRLHPNHESSSEGAGGGAAAASGSEGGTTGSTTAGGTAGSSSGRSSRSPALSQEEVGSTPAAATASIAPEAPQSRQDVSMVGTGGSSIVTVGPPSAPRVLLAIAEDKQWLSDLDCFVRRSLEVFCASEADVSSNQLDRRYPIKLGQVGIRCVFCALSPDGGSVSGAGTSVSYPYSINGIYETVREFQRLHLDKCPNLPDERRSKLSQLKTSASLSSVLRRYYVIAAKALGMYDTADGIRSEGGSIPVSSNAPLDLTPLKFVGSASASEEGAPEDRPASFSEVSEEDSRKRKELSGHGGIEPEDEGERPSKRALFDTRESG